MPALPRTTAATPAAGMLLMLAAMGSFTTMDTVSKVLTGSYDPIQVTWARYTFHALPMLLIAGPACVRRMAATTRPALQLTRALALLASAVLAIVGFSLMPLADLFAINFIAPLLVIVLSVLFLGEHVGPHRWAAVAAGFIGMLIIVWPSGDGVGVLGGLVAFGAALFWAVGLVATRRLDGEDPRTTLFITALVGTVLLSLAQPFVWTPPDAAGWGLMLAMGLLGLLSHTLLIAAFGQAPASTLAPFQYSQLIYGLAFGWLVFGDVIGARPLLGCAVIVAAGAYVWWREQRINE